MSRGWEREHRTLLIFYIGYVIVTMAKGDDGHPWTQKRTPQERQLLGGSCLFYGGLGRLGCVLRLCIISVQPLAQVVADYTGHNGDEKGDDILHGPTSFPLERVAALEIIPNFDRKSNTARLISEGCHKVGVINLQNIPTMAEHFGWNWKLVQLYFLRKKI